MKLCGQIVRSVSATNTAKRVRLTKCSQSHRVVQIPQAKPSTVRRASTFWTVSTVGIAPAGTKVFHPGPHPRENVATVLSQLFSRWCNIDRVTYREHPTTTMSEAQLCHFDFLILSYFHVECFHAHTCSYHLTSSTNCPASSVPVILRRASQSLLKSQSSFTAAPTVAISPKLAIKAVQSPAQRAPEFTAAPHAFAAKDR